MQKLDKVKYRKTFFIGIGTLHIFYPIEKTTRYFDSSMRILDITSFRHNWHFLWHSWYLKEIFLIEISKGPCVIHAVALRGACVHQRAKPIHSHVPSFAWLYTTPLSLSISLTKLHLPLNKKSVDSGNRTRNHYIPNTNALTAEL